MTQKEYIKALLKHLGGIDANYKSEILENINEHFDAGLSKGKSEDEIAQALGEPKTQAKLFILEQSIEKIKVNRNKKNYFNVILHFFSFGTSGLVSAIAATLMLSFWMLLVLLGITVLGSGVVLLLSACIKITSEKLLNTILSILLSIGIATFGALATIWIVKLLKPITGMLFRLAANLRCKNKLLKRSEVS